MLDKALDRLRCLSNRHDDIPVFLDGEAWRVYCRRCGRLDLDRKGYDLEQAQREVGLKKHIREQVAAGATQIWATTEKKEKKENDPTKTN